MTARERELERKLNMIVEALGGETEVEQMMLRRVTVIPQVTQQNGLGFIGRAETFYRDPNPADPTPLCFVPARYFNTSGLPYREPSRAADEREANSVIRARVYEGKWIVDCTDCMGAQVACETDPRFLCAQCQNRRHRGRWVTVVWPPRQEREEIERLLLHRPLVNRNWWPGEPPALLAAENLEHRCVA